MRHRPYKSLFSFVHEGKKTKLMCRLFRQNFIWIEPEDPAGLIYFNIGEEILLARLVQFHA